jgi:hypothetical protein
LSLQELAAEFQATTGKKLSRSSVKRRLNSEGVKSFKKELKPMLSSRNKKRCLEWAMRHCD